MPEGPSQASECGYVEAEETARDARANYQEAQRAPRRRARVEEMRRAYEAAEAGRQYAAQCEERARNWSDLIAQQQSARASVSMAQTAQATIIWTLLEIAALIATISVGIWAVMVTRAASKSEIRALNEESDRVAARFERERKDAREATAKQLRPYMTFEGLNYLVSFDSSINDGPKQLIVFAQGRTKNVGATPAIKCGIQAKARFVGPNDPPPADLVFDPSDSNVVVFPQVGAGTARCPLTEDILCRVFREELRVYFWTGIHYRDEFFPDVERYTEALVTLEIVSDPATWTEGIKVERVININAVSARYA